MLGVEHRRSGADRDTPARRRHADRHTVQSGAAATPTTTTNLVKVITGTGSTIAPQEIEFRLPPNVGRYVNVKFVAAGGTGDISGMTATITLRH